MFHRLSRILHAARRFEGTNTGIDTVRVQLARLHRWNLDRSEDLGDPRRAEFRAFSQFGEDGILQYVLSRTPSVPRSFVEFGIEDYREATTRLLSELGGWSGLVMDGSHRNIRRLKQDSIMWRSRLRAECHFLTQANINDLIAQGAPGPELGVLVIDIDGNDFWIWKAWSVNQPWIVVIEYNALWGVDRAVAVPYEPDFTRLSRHSSGLYWGASLPAAVALGSHKGYRLIAVNSQANNAFFIRTDVECTLKTIEVQRWMEMPGFQQARDNSGNLTYAGDRKSALALADLPLIDTITGASLRVRDVLGGTQGP